MKEIDLYIQEKLTLYHHVDEKLTLNPDSKISKDVDLDQLADDICDHLLVLRPNYFCEGDVKQTIKTWLKENDVKKVEYWTTEIHKNKIENAKDKRNIDANDYQYGLEDIEHKAGKLKQSYGIHNGSLFTTAKCIFISFKFAEIIYCFKKS